MSPNEKNINVYKPQWWLLFFCVQKTLLVSIHVNVCLNRGKLFTWNVVPDICWKTLLLNPEMLFFKTNATIFGVFFNDLFPRVSLSALKSTWVQIHHISGNQSCIFWKIINISNPFNKLPRISDVRITILHNWFKVIVHKSGCFFSRHSTVWNIWWWWWWIHEFIFKTFQLLPCNKSPNFKTPENPVNSINQIR